MSTETEVHEYVKLPLPVHAYLWDGSAHAPSHVPPGRIHDIYEMIGGQIVGLIETAEGQLGIRAGHHYIVGPGPGGEFWPVRKDIFEATYKRCSRG